MSARGGQKLQGGFRKDFGSLTAQMFFFMTDTERDKTISAGSQRRCIGFWNNLYACPLARLGEGGGRSQTNLSQFHLWKSWRPKLGQPWGVCVPVRRVWVGVAFSHMAPDARRRTLSSWLILALRVGELAPISYCRCSRTMVQCSGIKVDVGRSENDRRAMNNNLLDVFAGIRKTGPKENWS